MAEEIIKNVICENSVFLKEEYEDNDYLDDKTHVFQTITDMNNKHDPFELKELNKDTAELSKDISVILPLSHIKDESITVDVKTECDKYLSCSHCQEDYQDYCTKCQMLVHILDRNASKNTDKGVTKQIPIGILEIRELFGYVGIFALKVIPEGVQFGPIIGLSSQDYSWRIKEGKYITNNKQEFLHWMWYINSARNISQQNLLIFQCGGNLYYRCIREIQEDEELLVYFGKKYEENLNEDIERKFIPTIEEKVKDIFACTFCCLGFSDDIYLRKHKTICCNSNSGDSSIYVLEIIQCQVCKIYLEQKEYSEYHTDYCQAKHTRQCIGSELNEQISEEKNDISILNKSKTQKRETYNCLHCMYKTIYKSDLINHCNKHYPVKMYSCKICYRRFARPGTLKMHLVKVHNDIKRNPVQSQLENQYNCTKCEFKTHIRSRLNVHLYTHEKEKRFKCPECKYETNFKCHLNKHVNGKHCHLKRYKCSKCKFETFYQSNLIKHLYVHEEVKRFKCTECEFVTNNTPNLNRHINRKHCDAKIYKCSKCDFETSYQSNMRLHMYVHEGIKRLKCSECDYQTNRKRNLNAHINAKHSDEKAYKCSKCEFETSHGSSFKKHLDTHEEKKRGHKCSNCDYETHNKTYLRVHIKTKHCEIKKYKCLKCDYESAYDGSFRKHLYTHEDEKRLKCSLCDFKTNYKWHLRKHMDKKHTEEDI